MSTHLRSNEMIRWLDEFDFLLIRWLYAEAGVPCFLTASAGCVPAHVQEVACFHSLLSHCPVTHTAVRGVDVALRGCGLVGMVVGLRHLNGLFQA